MFSGRKEFQMPKSRLIAKLRQECPFCGEEHEVELRERTGSMMIRGALVRYPERYFLCTQGGGSEEEYEFETSTLLNENYIRAAAAYRESRGLLGAEEIQAIRERYAMKTSDLAALLGCSRELVIGYETMYVQDLAQDRLMKELRDHPASLMERLARIRESFSAESYRTIQAAALQQA